MSAIRIPFISFGSRFNIVSNVGPLTLILYGFSVPLLTAWKHSSPRALSMQCTLSLGGIGD